MNKIEKIENRYNVIRMIVSILIALVITFGVIVLVSDVPGQVISDFILGPTTTVRRMGNVVEAMIPLLFTGVAVSIMYSANQINMASEGAFFLGGIAASYVAINFVLPSGLHPLVAMLAGGLVGILVTVVPAILFIRYGSLPVVSSLMMNYVALYVGLFILNYVLRDPQAGYLASHVFSKSSKLPILVNKTSVHLGLIIGLLVVVFGHFFLEKSKYGYRIRVAGKNPKFAKYSGINVTATLLLSQIAGGFIAGLGGAVEQLGMYKRFQYQTLSNHGFDGVLIAIIARYRPKYVPLAAFFLAYIRVGADVISRTSNVPIEIVSVIQAIIIVFIASEKFLQKYKERSIVKEVTQTETAEVSA